MEEEIKSFHYDLALSSALYALDTFLYDFPHDHILHRSDFPDGPAPGTRPLAKELDE
jgi:hypothetical protein